MHGAHFQVALEFAEGFLHVQQAFVVSQNLLRRVALDGFIGVQQIPPVLLGLLDGTPSPTGRCTFSRWRLWKKTDQPLDSGLLGPVKRVPAQAFEFGK
jgi:hypothetical protein